MKKAVISVFILIISINALALGTIEAEYKLQNHPLVESLDYDGSSNSLGNAFTLKLKNGHEIYFSGVKSNFTFNKWSEIHYINDDSFSTVEYKFPENLRTGHGYLRLKDFCKATGINYNDLYSILDDYNEFCKLLNSMPWILDDDAEKLCVKYSASNYVYLYRGSLSTNQENKFIEIPKE